MKIYLFAINGRPGFRTDWRDAQAALEEHMRDHPDVSDIYWGDEGEERWRAVRYFYGSSHSDISANPEDDPYRGVDFETTDQLIWEVEVPVEPEQPNHALRHFGVGAEIELSIRTPEGTTTVNRRVPKPVWDASPLDRGQILMSFASMNAIQIATRWAKNAEVQR